VFELNVPAAAVHIPLPFNHKDAQVDESSTIEIMFQLFNNTLADTLISFQPPVVVLKYQHQVFVNNICLSGQLAQHHIIL
jgi:hypothetical protein